MAAGNVETHLIPGPGLADRTRSKAAIAVTVSRSCATRSCCPETSMTAPSCSAAHRITRPVP